MINCYKFISLGEFSVENIQRYGAGVEEEISMDKHGQRVLKLRKKCRFNFTEG